MKKLYNHLRGICVLVLFIGGAYCVYDGVMTEYEKMNCLYTFETVAGIMLICLSAMIKPVKEGVL